MNALWSETTLPITAKDGHNLLGSVTMTPLVIKLCIFFPLEGWMQAPSYSPAWATTMWSAWPKKTEHNMDCKRNIPHCSLWGCQSLPSTLEMKSKCNVDNESRGFRSLKLEQSPSGDFETLLSTVFGIIKSSLNYKSLSRFSSVIPLAYIFQQTVTPIETEIDHIH